MRFDRDVYFQTIKPLFGKFSQDQVDGQEAILTRWEQEYGDRDDPRHLAYCLATTFHETSKEMQPIEEYGKGEGMSYGSPDPETGQTYYGRGFVQLTWRDNYRRATSELHLADEQNLEWHAEQALDPYVASEVMFEGMEEGWFRTGSDGKPQTLGRYFSETVDDPYTAREIINGDKHIVPSWSNGVSIGNLIKDYHAQFLAALEAALIEEPAPIPEVAHVEITIATSGPVRVTINGVPWEPEE